MPTDHGMALQQDAAARPRTGEWVMPTDHGMALQQDAAARPSALNAIRAPGKAESAAPAYVVVEYAPESGPRDAATVHVRVFRIMNFKDTAGFMDKTDPYVQLQYGTTLHKTTAKNNAGGNAVFNEVFSFVRNPSENQLKVAVFDSDTLIDDLLGLTTIDLRSGRDVPADIPRGTRWDILRPRDSVEELRNMQEGQSYDVLDKKTGKVQGQVVLAFAVSVPPPPPPPEKAVHGLASHFAPKVTLLGGFVEGETVTAMIIFPDLPPRSPPVRMRFVTQWQREDVGTYWLTHGEAMARAKLRQRGHYEAVGEQAFFIPAIDAEPLDAKRFLPIGGEETTADGAVIKRQVVNTLQYECTRRDIGCRLRFTCQPVDLYGHVGRVVQAVTPHILCPFPRIRSMCVRDVQTGLTVATSRIRAAAAEMYLDAEMLNAPVKTHSLHVVANYVGGDEGATIVKWYRMKRIDPTGRGNSDSDFREIIISEQSRQYTVTDADVGCQLRVTVTPVRADGTMGHPSTLFTTGCSNSCPYSSMPHAHIHGVCPFQLSMVDLVSKTQKDMGLPPAPPVQQPVIPDMPM